MCPRGLYLFCLPASLSCHFHLAFSPRYWTNSRSLASSLPAACSLCSSTFCPYYSAFPFLFIVGLTSALFPCFFLKVIFLLRWASKHPAPRLDIQDSDHAERKKAISSVTWHVVKGVNPWNSLMQWTRISAFVWFEYQYVSFFSASQLMFSDAVAQLLECFDNVRQDGQQVYTLARISQVLFKSWLIVNSIFTVCVKVFNQNK